jgi:outer membrane protein TolC
LPKNVATLGVQISWEPWDWGRKKTELLSKNRTIEQSGLATREAENSVLVEVNQLHRKLGEAKLLLDVAEMSREAEREKLRVVQAQYSEQAALLKDVMQMQSAVADANHSHRQALLGYWTARADFERALGEEQ